MKKNYVYFLVPLAAMIAFGAYYWNFTAGYDAMQAEKDLAAQKVQEAQRLEEASQRQKAVDDAYAQGLKRKAEREAKAAREQKEEDDKTNATEANQKIHREVGRLRDKVESLERQVKETEDDLAKFNLDKEQLAMEQTSINSLLPVAEANTKALSDVLGKIAAADAAIEAAAKAAAAAKKE